MRLATAASPTCCAPPVLIVTRQLVSPAAPNPAPPSGKLAKYTMPASRPAASNAASPILPARLGMTAHRFPPLCSAEETDACFIVKDSAGQSLFRGRTRTGIGGEIAQQR